MKLLDAWRALLGGFAQNTRLVQLHLGADAKDPENPAGMLLAERIDVQEAMGPGWQPHGGSSFAPAGLRLEVHALAEDAGLDLESLQCRAAQVVLQTQQGPRSWHGHVKRAEMLGSDGGLTRYRFVIEPWLAFATLARDDRKFKNRSVPQIIDEVFARYRSRGVLNASWRFDLANPDAYPTRSDCSQFRESDFDFVQRLMREEGLFGWFEHGGTAGCPDAGRHEFVVTDHNGTFSPASQPRVRYTQAHVPLGEDSITRWRRSVHVRACSLELMSPDRRSTALHKVAQRAATHADIPLHPSLAHSDLPGVYAFPSTSHGEQLAMRQMQAIDARREEFTAWSSVRTMAPGRTFTFTDHPLHRGDDPERDQFTVIAVHHRARSNLPADLQSAIESQLGSLWSSQGAKRSPKLSDEPVYSCRVHLQRTCVPMRLTPLDQRGEPDPRLQTRRVAHGVQTATVVSAGSAIDSDRDHQVKVRHHWQRGTQASHPLPAPESDNAPGGDAFASVMPVAETVAGPNWGTHFIKRAWQEVVIGHLHGQVDRGVILGSVYNGRGRENGAGNEVPAGAGGAIGNAPSWFPGDEASEPWQGHRHGPVLTGFKSQEVGTSQVGGGSANTLVFCDSPVESRIELGTAAAATRLQLGNLGHLSGNKLLEQRGSGWSLETTAWGALRAGSGLLLSTYRSAGTAHGAQQLDCVEPRRQIEQAVDRLHALAESAHKQHATLVGDPDLLGAGPSESKRQLPTERGWQALSTSLRETDHRGQSDMSAPVEEVASGQASQAPKTIGGGGGTVAAWTRPDIIVAAPGGIGAVTPATTLLCAGESLSVVAVDVHHIAHGDHAAAMGQGVVLYTYGKTAEGGKVDAELGIRLHAAQGSVCSQSQTGGTRLTSDRKLSVASGAALQVTAPVHILLTASGAALQIQSGGITLKGPGKVEFKAAMKEFAGPAIASATVKLPKPGKLGICRYRLAGAPEGVEAE